MNDQKMYDDCSKELITAAKGAMGKIKTTGSTEGMEPRKATKDVQKIHIHNGMYKKQKSMKIDES